MARKNTLQFKVASAQSMAASFNSAPTIVRNLDNCSYQINITTSNSTGTFAIQGSDDYDINEPSNNVLNSGTWVNIPLSGTPTAAAANDSILIDLNQMPFNALRVAYTSTVAGTGTLDIYMTAKQIGG